MSEQQSKNKAVDLGVEMWLMLQSAFDEIATANGIATKQEKACLYAGLLSAIVGSATADVGASYTQTIIDGAKEASMHVNKSTIALVKN